jgi:hypothetical protein
MREQIKHQQKEAEEMRANIDALMSRHANGGAHAAAAAAPSASAGSAHSEADAGTQHSIHEKRARASQDEPDAEADAPRQRQRTASASSPSASPAAASAHSSAAASVSASAAASAAVEDQSVCPMCLDVYTTENTDGPNAAVDGGRLVQRVFHCMHGACTGCLTDNMIDVENK